MERNDGRAHKSTVPKYRISVDMNGDQFASVITSAIVIQRPTPNDITSAMKVPISLIHRHYGGRG